MQFLFARVCELKEEYFNEFTRSDIYNFCACLDQDRVYTSGELIEIMGKFSDLFNLRKA